MVKKVMVWVTNGPDDPEKAVLPFIIANAGFVHDAKVYIMLAGAGVWLAKKGGCRTRKLLQMEIARFTQQFSRVRW